ncbi:UNVERIFIED_CONTAM: hypothetical protein HDU68_008288 [Siphonaria sp. JEL0065]|nr:hypothetical protein HDU68_008288 [Siphonaria sp. JEL0065]
MQFGKELTIAAALALTANAQITAAGCSNLQSVFTAFGFPTAASGTVNQAFTGCGCSFAVTATNGSSAAASCQIIGDVWTIYSLSVSSPPTTLSAFPPVLVTNANSPGFEWTQSLAFTNNALTGNALVLSESLPSRTSTLDLSNNPGLAQWPALNLQGQIPNLSFQTITLTGDPNLCCPAQGTNGNLPTCIPASTPRCAASTAVPNLTATAPNNGNPPATGTSNNSGVNVWVAPTPSLVPYISPINAPGTIVVIAIGVLLFVGGFVLGGVMYFSRKNQKPVIVFDEDLELENGKGNKVGPSA